MKTVRDILDTLGRKRLANALGLKVQAISVAGSNNSFPPSWYPTIKRCAEEDGIEVSDTLFSWRENKLKDHTNSVDA